MNPGKPLRPFLVLAVIAMATALASCTAAATATPTPAPRATPTTVVPTPTSAPQATPTSAPQATATATPRATSTPAPTPTPSAGTPKRGGIATLPNWGDPPGWEPNYFGTINVLNVTTPMSGEYNLVRLCRGSINKMCEGLAKDWSSNADFSEWTFTIRDNAFWHDGRPLTVEDVKWWLELSTKPPQGRATAGWVGRMTPFKQIDILDGNRIKITLTKPTLRFLEQWTSTQQRVFYPRHLMQPQIDAGNAKVAPNEVGYVGTGPYKFESYTKGSVVRIRRFDKYWEKDAAGGSLPYLDGVDIPITTDHSTMVAAFRSGRLDATLRWCNQCVTPAIQERAERELGAGNVYAIRVPAYPAWVSINNNVAPWSDVRVRQALNLWLDRQGGLAAMFSGLGRPVGLFVEGTGYTNPDLRQWPGLNPATKQQDRQRAKELLAEAGYPNGFPVKLFTRDLYLPMGAEWLATEMAALLGQANVSIDSLDTATFTTRSAARDWIVNYGSTGPYVHPEEGRELWRAKTGTFVQHTDTKVDEYFERLATLPDGPERIALAQELERYFIKEKMYAVPLWIWEENRLFRSYVKGVPRPEIAVNWSIDLVTEWLDK